VDSRPGDVVHLDQDVVVEIRVSQDGDGPTVQWVRRADLGREFPVLGVAPLTLVDAPAAKI
jgi:hypothetical protein